MVENILLESLKNLVKRKPLFHSEADFQFNLAWEIQLQFPEVKCILEKPVESYSVDLILKIKEDFYPIELKYKTRKLSIEFDGQIYNLKHQAANDISRFDVIKDIVKIEELILIKGIFKLGYVIFLTNDYLFWNETTYESYDKKFHLYENSIIKDTLRWSEKTSIGTNKGREELNPINSYKCIWNPYSDLEIANSKFRLLLFEIK